MLPLSYNCIVSFQPLVLYFNKYLILSRKSLSIFVCVVSEDGVETRWRDRVPDEQRLFEQLLVDCEPAVRPVYNSSQRVLVHFRLTLYQIVDLVCRIPSSVFSMIGFIILTHRFLAASTTSVKFDIQSRQKRFCWFGAGRNES